MKYIDLHLSSEDSLSNNLCTLNEILQQNSNIVIIGSPGSGKTSILKKYHEKHINTQLVSVKKLLRHGNTQSQSEILLIDGLDEYRLTNTDKTFVVTDLANKIKEVSPKSRQKVVVSCRELDWYGESDIKALKDVVGEEFKVFHVCPPNHEQQKALAELYLESNISEFLQLYSNTGFLNNPQLLYLCAKIFQNNSLCPPKSPLEIYDQFINLARESNEEYKRNSEVEVDTEEFQEIIGYLSFFYFFSSVDVFSEEIIDQIASNKSGFSKRKLLMGLGSKLFDKACFIHRSIAEYSCGLFLSELLTRKRHSFRRVQGLFKSGERVPTEFRGVISWLTSISRINDFLYMDPVHQALLGDASSFSFEQRKILILEVKNQARQNPYFFSSYFTREIYGLYHPDLDDFLIAQYEASAKLDNHYPLFLSLVITSQNDISKNLIEYIKTVVFRNELSSHRKTYILDAIINDDDCMKALLLLIKDNEIEDDEDSLKEYIFSRRYPDLVNSEQIVEYIKSYKQAGTIGHFHFLLSTPVKEKFELVLLLLKHYKNTSNDTYLKLPPGIESFVSEFIVDLALEFDSNSDVNAIYQQLKEINSFFGLLSGPRFTTYRSEARRRLETNKENLAFLANQLFTRFIDDLLKTDEELYRHNEFEYFFGLQQPTERLEILMSKLSNRNTEEQNLTLLKAIHSEMKMKNENQFDLLIQLSSKYDLDVIVTEWLKQTKPKYQLVWEKQDKERCKEKEEQIKKNENFFDGKSDETLAKDFNVLKFTKDLVFISGSKEYKNHISKNLYIRLQKILQSILLLNSNWSEYLTLKSLAKDSPNARREIDYVYYTACQLNTATNYKQIKDQEFMNYLYIISFRIGRSSNVIQGEYLSWFEQDQNKTITILKHYIHSVIQHHLPDINCSRSFQNIIALDSNIERIKNIGHFFVYDDDVTNSFLKELLFEYVFELSITDLKQIKEQSTINKKNMQTVTAILAIHENAKDKFTRDMAVNVFEVLTHWDRKHSLAKIPGNLPHFRGKIVDFMFHVFDTFESIEFHSGLQSNSDQCASYLRHSVLNELSKTELSELLMTHNKDDDIWKNNILNRINQLEQSESDSNKIEYTLQESKEFILAYRPLSKKDFFLHVLDKLQERIDTIRSNRNRELQLFWNDTKPKIEEDCRDIILQKMEDRYKEEFLLTKEKHESNNRVDLNVKFAQNFEYEVQIECKRDSNSGIYDDIENQLISKYLENKVDYGIYLVFCFKKETQIESLITELTDRIPKKYSHRIKVICLDLRI